MTFESPSTPSEGEIVESDSEKATTSLRMINGANVDSQSRICASVSLSPSPDRSLRRHLSRTPSRSPYRELRGAKRPRDDDHDFDRSRNGPRRFKLRYEDRSLGVCKTSHNKYDDLDRPMEPNPYLRYEDRPNYRQMKANRPRTQSRSPFRQHSNRLNSESCRGSDKNLNNHKSGWDDQDNKGYPESRSRLSSEQSVSDRGQSSVAAALLRRDAENRPNQNDNAFRPMPNTNNHTAMYVVFSFHCSSLIVKFQGLV